MRALTTELPIAELAAKRPRSCGFFSLRPTSIRVLVVGCTAANVRFGVSSETYPLRAWIVNSPKLAAQVRIACNFGSQLGPVSILAVDQLVGAG